MNRAGDFQELARARPFAPASQPMSLASPAEIMPILRGRPSRPTAVEGRPRRMVLTFRASPAILDLCNAVNANRIRTGLMTDAMVAERSKARGVTLEACMRGSLLKREALASDVAAAFVHPVKARAARNIARGAAHLAPTRGGARLLRTGGRNGGTSCAQN